jgi:hypothetical protein
MGSERDIEKNLGAGPRQTPEWPNRGPMFLDPCFPKVSVPEYVGKNNS